MLEVPTYRIMLLDQYQADQRRRKLSEATLRTFGATFRNYAQWLNGRDPYAIRRADIEEWISAQSWAPSSQRTALAHVRAAYVYAVDHEYTDRNPCRKVSLDEEVSKRPRVLRPPTIEALEANCRDSQDVVYLRMHLYTGLRAIEARAVTINDVEDEMMLIHGKGSHERVVPIHPRLREALIADGRHAYLIHHKRNLTQLSDQGSVGRLKAITGGLDVQRHDFRRTFVTSLRRAGVDREVVMDMVGHKRSSVHDLYDAVDPDEMRAAILRLPY